MKLTPEEAREAAVYAATLAEYLTVWLADRSPRAQRQGFQRMVKHLEHYTFEALARDKDASETDELGRQRTPSP